MWGSVLFLLFLGLCHAKVSVGPFSKENHQWVLLDSFCFDERGGELRIEDVVPFEKYPNQKLGLYHDLDTVPGGFPGLYLSHKSCSAKLRDAPRANLTSELAKGPMSYTIQTIMPRWWYLVLINCDPAPLGEEGVGLHTYTITWTNSKPGDGDATSRYVHHFGKDEEGMYEGLVVFLILLMILIGATGYSYWKLRKIEDSLAHKALLIILVTMGVHIFSVILNIAHRNQYADDGIGLPSVVDLAYAIDQIPHLLLVALFILIGKGLFISSDQARDIRSVVEVMVLYLVTTIGLLYWAYSGMDPGYQYMPYQSAAGVILVCLRIVTLFWFLSSLQITYRRERASFKKMFYVGFALFGTFWFLTFPIVVAAAESLATYNRKKSVFIIEQVFQLFSYMVFWFLFAHNHQFLKKSESSHEHGALGQEDMGDHGPGPETAI